MDVCAVRSSRSVVYYKALKKIIPATSNLVQTELKMGIAPMAKTEKRRRGKKGKKAVLI